MTDREERIMRTSTRRLRISATRTLGLRRPVDPKPSPDLRVFRVMRRLSVEATRAYMAGLIGPR
jgi:hypothetical protein